MPSRRPLNANEVYSEPARKRVIDWYGGALVSRLNDKNTGSIIAVMQRLHEDDLAGHLLEQGGWEVVSFPCIAEKDEVHVIDTPFGRREFRRRKGEVLDPSRESLETLDAIRKSVGDFVFQSQYQQNPMPVEGNMVKTEWLARYRQEDLPARFEYVLHSWDTANKAGELNDFSVCTTWGVFQKRYYLLDSSACELPIRS